MKQCDEYMEKIQLIKDLFQQADEKAELRRQDARDCHVFRPVRGVEDQRPAFEAAVAQRAWLRFDENRRAGRGSAVPIIA